MKFKKSKKMLINMEELVAIDVASNRIYLKGGVVIVCSPETATELLDAPTVSSNLVGDVGKESEPTI